MKRLLPLLMTAILAFSCADDALDKTCSVPATVRDLKGLDGCGFVFQLSDGTNILPVVPFCGTPPFPEEWENDPLRDFEFVDGKRVLISYEEIDERATICMAGTVARITCLTEIANPVED